MKRSLLLTIVSLFIANAAIADHIGIYTDATGSSCQFAATPVGALTTATIVHKFATGATASRFKVSGPNILGYSPFPPPFVAIGNYADDLVITYGSCLSGSFAIGAFLAFWWAPGTAVILPAIGFPSVLYSDCAAGEEWTWHPATGGTASIGGGPGCEELAVEPSTWGRVKSLYR